MEEGVTTPSETIRDTGRFTLPEEEKYLNTKSELEAMIVECLGGRAAEEIVFGNVTTGASNDIEKATKIVRAMITQYLSLIHISEPTRP